MSLKHLINQAGDTIIEVLIAMSIAGLAIGISYATASRAIGRAITARERDQAVGIMETQVSRLKAIEAQLGLGPFNTAFSNTSAPHFCLNSSSTSPILNHGNIDSSTKLATQPPAPYYDSRCVSGSYYIDIETTKVNGKITPYIYQVNIRWVPYQGTTNNQVTLYYRF